ncbi:MAG TPA: NYN domain-containing protein [Ktedonobacteraceae bacterium]|jgi:uncharacterized LabA/DUF88 family protein|nr:NYN domain-containing protein [Ktedonobacteraceae bacterium]
MAKEKVVVFLDFANVNRASREKRLRLDYHHLLQYLGEGRFLVDAYAYVPVNPRNEHRSDGIIEALWRSGYIVTTKLGTIAGGTYKCNFDVEIAMDVQRVVYQVKPDILVLASGDSDFVPLIQEVRKAGVRVEVAAFEENAGPDIMLKCSGFINLGVYYDSYLAALDGEEERIEDQYANLISSQNGASESIPEQPAKEGEDDEDVDGEKEVAKLLDDAANAAASEKLDDLGL